MSSFSGLTRIGDTIIDCRRPTAAYFPDPHDCRNFFHCSDWTGLQKKSCGNLYFNPETGVCDWPNIVRQKRPECPPVSAGGVSQIGPQPPENPRAFQGSQTIRINTAAGPNQANPVRFPQEAFIGPQPRPNPQQARRPVAPQPQVFRPSQTTGPAFSPQPQGQFDTQQAIRDSVRTSGGRPTPPEQKLLPDRPPNLERPIFVTSPNQVCSLLFPFWYENYLS